MHYIILKAEDGSPGRGTCHLNLLMVRLGLRWVGHYIILKAEDGSPGRGTCHLNLLMVRLRWEGHYIVKMSIYTFF